MNVEPLTCCCLAVRGGTYQWMTKANLETELDESRCLRGRRRVPAQPESVGRKPQQRGVAERFSRGQGQQQPRVPRQGPQPSCESVLERSEGRQLTCVGQPFGKFRGRPRVWQLQQRQR